MTADRIAARDVYLARRAIAPHVVRAPLVRSPSLSDRTRSEVYLKLETVQDTGSFKIRGATNRLLALSREDRGRGVVAASTGNHGRAVAHAAKTLGVPAVICLSRQVPEHKVSAVRSLGAKVVAAGESQDEAEAEAARLAAEEGLVAVSAFDDVHVIAGQGTIGLELLEDRPDLDTVVVPLSGGGLLGGIALAVKAAAPDIELIGVSMKRGPAMHRSLQAGKPVAVAEEPTLADALAGGIGLDNRYSFALVRDLVDDVVLVDEIDIAAAMAHAYHMHGIVVEGGGAVGIAALLTGAVAKPGKRVAVVVSGRNVDMAKFETIVRAAPAV